MFNVRFIVLRKLTLFFLCLCLISCSKDTRKQYIGIVVDVNEKPVVGARVILTCQRGASSRSSGNEQICGEDSTEVDGSFEFFIFVKKREALWRFEVSKNGKSVAVKDIPGETRNEMKVVFE
jgi:hypothetical protein